MKPKMTPIRDKCKDCMNPATHEVTDATGQVVGRFCRPCARYYVDGVPRMEMPQQEAASNA